MSTIAARFAGLRPLLRKEFAEWRHGRRIYVIPAVMTLFMVLSAANSWIIAQIIANTPQGSPVPDAPVSLEPLQNLMAAVGSQIFVLAAIFATMSLLVGERERGTLAWVASKPVSRGAIWAAKAIAGVAVVGLVAVAIPMAITAAVVAVLYGVPALGAVLIVTAGMVVLAALFVVVGLAVSTVVANQAAVAAIGFGAFVVPSLLVAIVPFDLQPYLPTSILGWAAGVAVGAPVGVVTPIVWAISMAALAVVAIRRLELAEL
ncbi:MAG TPA: ABC transporter permease subunit [Candidatus Limnocylindrales bacterium]|nr:ABC transporter permease subunit [Candidatus Limnocylindrales bacterium]